MFKFLFAYSCRVLLDTSCFEATFEDGAGMLWPLKQDRGEDLSGICFHGICLQCLFQRIEVVLRRCRCMFCGKYFVEGMAFSCNVCRIRNLLWTHLLAENSCASLDSTFVHVALAGFKI